MSGGYHTAELDRRVAQVVEIGTVVAVSGATVRMAIGDIETGDIPVGSVAMGATRIKTMPSVGEQRLIFAPGGDMARAVAGPAIAAGNMPDDDNEHAVIDLGGAELRITGDVIVNGAIRTSGEITSQVDVLAQSVSLYNHTHGGVTPGNSTTKEPTK